MTEKYIGVDIGGTKCAVTLGYLKGSKITIDRKIVFPTQVTNGPDQTIKKIISAIEDISVSNLSGIGISCGGPLDPDKGMILSPPNLPGWDDIKIVDILRNRFKTSVKLMNDANACAVAEWKFGAGAGCKNMIFLTFGTGMGAGMILNNSLYEGSDNMAGEIGHVRMSPIGPVGYGKSGSFEGFCSGSGIAQISRMKALEIFGQGKSVSFCKDISQIDKIDAKIVADAAYSGDITAIEIYKICGEYLGKGLSILVDLLNPEMIVIGSVFTRSHDLLWPRANQIMQKECLEISYNSCRVVPAALGESLGDIASICAVLYQQ